MFVVPSCFDALLDLLMATHRTTSQGRVVLWRPTRYMLRTPEPSKRYVRGGDCCFNALTH